jgi:hypothetical protein
MDINITANFKVHLELDMEVEDLNTILRGLEIAESMLPSGLTPDIKRFAQALSMARGHISRAQSEMRHGEEAARDLYDTEGGH